MFKILNPTVYKELYTMAHLDLLQVCKAGAKFENELM